MAFKYNGTSPTAIKYNGTDLTVLKYGTTAVWGKPYSLSISAGANTTVTVTRTSSPNQNASTGNLSSGSVVYYGDVLKITATSNSGYQLTTFTVNGTNFTSGNTITVTEAINVVGKSTVNATWKTVWTGSKSFTNNGSFTDIVGNYPTKITGKIAFTYFIGWTPTTEETSFTGVLLPTTQKVNIIEGNVSVNGNTNALDITFNLNGGVGSPNLTLTKVEQYY